MKTYLFYDIETSGLNPAFDQVLTFACIRTDLKLNEINRQTVTVRLRKDIVPSARAFLTHGLTYKELELGISEYEAAFKIHKILNTPGTISLGYNSLGFDDEFLRFLFYRNLLDPYSHQYGKGCSRMDILPVTVIFRVFHPAGLRWPQIDGKPSLKLDLISRENNFVTSGRAHEALSDVEAVIQLSKIFFLQKDIWEYSLDFFNKQRDEIRIDSIEKGINIQNMRFKTCLMVSASFGSKVNYMAPVVRLGQSTAYKNQSLWLRLDADDILGLDAGLDIKDTFVIRKRPADALVVLPALERFWNKLPKSSQESAKCNIEKMDRHWEKFFEFIQYHREFKYTVIPNMDPDAALYQDGFFSPVEKNQIALFHKTQDHKKYEILEKIQSPRIKILAGRILARNFKAKIDQTDRIGQTDQTSQTNQAGQSEYHSLIARLSSLLKKDQIVGYRNDRKFNCGQGLQELKEVEQERSNPNPETKEMLHWIKEYIENL